MKKKELEFNINGNLLEVADFTWCIDRINAIYVAPYCNNLNMVFAIFVATNNEIVKLYFEHKNLEVVLHQFKKLCSAISEVKQNFKTYANVFFNFDNIKNFEHFYIIDEIRKIKGNHEYFAKVMAISKGGMAVNFVLTGKELESFKAEISKQKEESFSL